MNPIKKLASQTVVYGLSSIIGRFLNYLLVPVYTYTFSAGEYGVVSEFYAYSGFFAVLLVFGLETGYFRFSQNQEQKEKVYATALNAVLLANLLFVGLLVFFVSPLSELLRYPQNHEYFYWFAGILALDSVSSIPFARLRSENKALKFAGIKLFEIGVTVLLNVFVIIVCRKAHAQDSSSFLGSLYNPQIGVGYIFIINLIASLAKMLLLLPMLRSINLGIDKELFRKMLRYSLPMVVIGFAGIINEMLDRVALKYLLPFDNETNMQQLGIYGACYKLSVLMTLFIQAFRYAAEPFFFSHAKEKGSRKVYADVMKYFVIVCVFVFLLVMLYLPWLQLFIGKEFRVGLGVVPILLIANLCLGMYVNLSIWYKLTDRTLTGAWVSVGGAVLTLALNILLVPTMGYIGSAWATLACYAGMAVVSYALGQKYFPVEYDLKKILGYTALGILLWLGFNEVTSRLAQVPFWLPATGIMLLFSVVVFWFDGRSLLSRASKAANV